DFNRGFPQAFRRPTVLWVNGLQPSVAKRGLRCSSGHLAPSLVDIHPAPFPVRAEDADGGRGTQQPEQLFTFTNGLLRFQALRDIQIKRQKSLCSSPQLQGRSER